MWLHWSEASDITFLTFGHTFGHIIWLWLTIRCIIINAKYFECSCLRCSSVRNQINKLTQQMNYSYLKRIDRGITSPNRTSWQITLSKPRVRGGHLEFSAIFHQIKNRHKKWILQPKNIWKTVLHYLVVCSNELYFNAYGLGQSSWIYACKI